MSNTGNVAGLNIWSHIKTCICTNFKVRDV